MTDCDCRIIYEPVEIHLRALASDGAEVPASDWLTLDSIIDFDVSPDLEAGVKKIIKCNGRPKVVIQSTDALIGAEVKLTFCCENAEVDYILGGSCGTVVYDSSSPPCAVSYENPTLAEQQNAVPFEMKIYLKEVLGSDVTGYKELWFFYCLPNFASEKGAQEDYVNPSYSIHCLENRNY